MTDSTFFVYRIHGVGSTAVPHLVSSHTSFSDAVKSLDRNNASYIHEIVFGSILLDTYQTNHPAVVEQRKSNGLPT